MCHLRGSGFEISKKGQKIFKGGGRGGGGGGGGGVNAQLTSVQVCIPLALLGDCLQGVYRPYTLTIAPMGGQR